MRQSRTRLTLCAAVASAALITVPAAIAATASSSSVTGRSATPAGTIAVNAACYVNTARAAAKVTVTGSGWSPGDTIQLTDTRGVVTTTVTVSSAGAFTAVVPAPVVPTRDIEISDKIQAIDEGTQGIEGTAPAGGPTAYSPAYLATDFAVKVSDDVSPLRKMLFNLSGFTPDRAVFGHYLTASGRLLGTASFGTPTGACGLRKVDAYEYPGGKARKGAYVIQFDNDAHYSQRSSPAFRYSYVITRL